jgi:hypothetical protein
MKHSFSKYILVIVLVLSAGNATRAQKGFCLGVNAGYNSSFVFDRVLLGDVKYNYYLKTGPAFGVAGGYNFTNMVGIEAEYNYVDMGQNYSIPQNNSHINERLDIQYFQVPVMFKFTGGDYKSRFSSMFGPVFGFLSAAQLSSEATNGSSTNVYQRMNISDLGILASAGGDITFKNHLYLNLSLRFYYGFNTINKDPMLLMSGAGENENLANAYAGINIGIYNLFPPNQ